MRFQSSKAVASSCRRRGRNRGQKYTWFAQVLDVNHTGPTTLWANRQSGSLSEDPLPLESFIQRPIEQHRDIHYLSGKVVLRPRERFTQTFEEMMAQKVSCAGVAALDFGDKDAWPSLKSAQNYVETEPPTSDFSFVCSLNLDNDTDSKKYMSASPADNEWLCLSHKQLYIDIVKGTNMDVAELEKEDYIDTVKEADARGYSSDSANWTFLDHDTCSTSSYLSEEEDGLGEATPMETEPASSGSVFGFLW